MVSPSASAERCLPLSGVGVSETVHSSVSGSYLASAAELAHHVDQPRRRSRRRERNPPDADVLLGGVEDIVLRRRTTIPST